MNINKPEIEKIERFMIEITESEEYQSREYLIFSIRKDFLNYLTITRLNNFEVPKYLEKLVEYVDTKFWQSNISPNDMLNYMLSNDKSNWVQYYVCVGLMRGSNSSEESVQCDKKIFMLILTGYILEVFKNNQIDIQRIVNSEQFIYETNQYGLSIVNGVEFRRDYFIFDNKAYLYSILTNTDVIHFGDNMPGFAKIITENINSGDVLLRLDERLALPVDQAISYSSLNFEKFYGPQFHFKDSKFEKQKTVIVHMDNETCNKLLMVIKKDYDSKRGTSFFHVEIETLPYVNETSDYTRCITTFLHGMYYPSDDFFTHIDYTRNQYEFDDYLKKYTESTTDIPIDFYAEKELHYKIWCIENGKYSREIWYKLMVVSLSESYQILLDEMLA